MKCCSFELGLHSEPYNEYEPTDTNIVYSCVQLWHRSVN